MAEYLVSNRKGKISHVTTCFLRSFEAIEENLHVEEKEGKSRNSRKIAEFAERA